MNSSTASMHGLLKHRMAERLVCDIEGATVDFSPSEDAYRLGIRSYSLVVGRHVWATAKMDRSVWIAAAFNDALDELQHILEGHEEHPVKPQSTVLINFFQAHLSEYPTTTLVDDDPCNQRLWITVIARIEPGRKPRIAKAYFDRNTLPAWKEFMLDKQWYARAKEMLAFFRRVLEKPPEAALPAYTVDQPPRPPTTSATTRIETEKGTQAMTPFGTIYALNNGTAIEKMLATTSAADILANQLIELRTEAAIDSRNAEIFEDLLDATERTNISVVNTLTTQLEFIQNGNDDPTLTAQAIIDACLAINKQLTKNMQALARHLEKNAELRQKPVKFTA